MQTKSWSEMLWMSGKVCSAVRSSVQCHQQRSATALALFNVLSANSVSKQLSVVDNIPECGNCTMASSFELAVKLMDGRTAALIEVTPACDP